MSRPTNTERGARLAYDIALEHLQQLFPANGLGHEFWSPIADEAAVTLAECRFLRAAQVERVALSSSPDAADPARPHADPEESSQSRPLPMRGSVAKDRGRSPTSEIRRAAQVRRQSVTETQAC